MARSKQDLNGQVSSAAVAATAPDTKTAEEQIAELQEQLNGAHEVVRQLSQQLDNASIELSVMRDRFTEELNDGNRLRANQIKLEQKIASLEQAQEGNKQ